MKFTSQLLLVLFTSAMAACTSFESNDKEPSHQVVTSADVVYIDTEQALATSDIFLKEGEPLQQRSDKAQGEWERKDQAIRGEMERLNERFQKGLITTADAQREQLALEQRMSALQSLVESEASVLDEESRVLANRMQDLLRRSVKSVNDDGRYKFILNAAIVVDADTTLNITPAVLAKMNELYTKEKR